MQCIPTIISASYILLKAEVSNRLASKGGLVGYRVAELLK